MVYRGKPSKGCLHCRTKKITCDLSRPACGQCSRVGRKCVGYRNMLDLMFRDQSEEIKTKVLSSKTTEKCHAPFPTRSPRLCRPSSPPESSDSDEQAQDRNAFTILNLSISAQDQAPCFFFGHYVLEDSPISNGYFNHLPKLYSNSPMGSALTNIVTSLGMACLSIDQAIPQIMTSARLKYAEALRMVGDTLNDPREAKADQTLMTVMLLALYESSSDRNPQSMRCSTKHLNGAIALLNIRGIQQLKSKTSRQLFTSLRFQAISNCLHSRTEVPEHIIEWSKLSARFETPDEFPESALFQIFAKVCNLRVTSSNSRDYITTLTSALSIDTDLAEWAATLPLDCKYTTVTFRSKSKDFLSDYHHSYRDIGTATLWNHYRSIRILVNEIVLDQFTHLKELFHPDSGPDIPSLYQSRIRASKFTIMKLIYDICASVPFHLRYHNHREGWQSVPAPPRAVNGRNLLWPLYVAGKTSLCPEAARAWVVGRLEAIGEKMGIRRADALARVVKAKKVVPLWEIKDAE